MNLHAFRSLVAILRSAQDSQRLRLVDARGEKVLLRSDGLILAVSEVVWDLLALLGSMSDSQCFDRLKERHGASAVKECVEELQMLVEQGLFEVEQDQGAPLPAPGDVQPSGILLMVSQICNLACSYCYAGGGTYGSSVALMPEERAEAVIDLLLSRSPDKAIYRVIFFGGEPLLNFKLVRHVVEYCERKSVERTDHPEFRFSMTTNGTILTAQIVEFLREHAFALMVSFDGMGAHAEKRRFRSGRSSEALVMRNIQRLTRAGLRVQLRATITPEMLNSETLEQLVKAGERLDAERILTSPVECSAPDNSVGHPTASARFDAVDLGRLEELYAKVTEQNILDGASNERVVFDPHVSLMKALASGRAVGTRKCGACYSMAAVATDGCIYPCHRFVGMRSYSIGTVETGFDHDRIRQFFGAIEEAYGKKCSRCWARTLCGGVCYHHRADGKGGFLPPDAGSCRSFEKTVDNAVGFLMTLVQLPPDARVSYLRRVNSL